MAAQPEPIGRWYWCSDGNTWHNYDHGVCKILEQAMKLDMSRVYVDTERYVEIVSYDKFKAEFQVLPPQVYVNTSCLGIQRRKDDPTKRRGVKREPPVDNDAPKAEAPDPFHVYIPVVQALAPAPAPAPAPVVFAPPAPKAKLIVKSSCAVDPEVPFNEKLHVYEEGVVVYSCVLVLANPKTGKNQFKIRQILQSDANPHSVSLWKRGGRVGEKGNTYLYPPGKMTVSEAKHKFESSFLKRTGKPWYTWSKFKPKFGMFCLVKMEYKLDIKGEYRDGAWYQYIEYDPTKQPLGRILKAQWQMGWEKLQELHIKIQEYNLKKHDPVKAMTLYSKIEKLSGKFYSIIPHNFGAAPPPVIDTLPLYEKELNALDSIASK